MVLQNKIRSNELTMLSVFCQAAPFLARMALYGYSIVNQTADTHTNTQYSLRKPVWEHYVWDVTILHHNVPQYKLASGAAFPPVYGCIQGIVFGAAGTNASMFSVGMVGIAVCS